MDSWKISRITRQNPPKNLGICRPVLCVAMAEFYRSPTAPQISAPIGTSSMNRLGTTMINLSCTGPRQRHKIY
jgi:hypothetical protein